MGGELAGHGEHFSSGLCGPVGGGEGEPIVSTGIKGEGLENVESINRNNFARLTG